jgi:hypothetical protein
MTFKPAPAETALLWACAALLLAAVFGPSIAQPADHHHFADTRAWLGVPYALDVLSNLPFALWGVAGLLGLRRSWRAPAHGVLSTQRPLAAVFFAGLVLTAAASGLYHWQPDDGGLALDRLGMVVAFAGLLGLAAAERVSGRAGYLLAVGVLVLGPASVAVWFTSGNVLPWVVLQVGGMGLILALAWRQALPSALGIRLSAVIALYALAKACELGDHAIFAFTDGAVSGHSLKHLLASFAAWPVLAAVGAAARRQPNGTPAKAQSAPEHQAAA